MASDWTVLATAPTIEGVGQASAEMLIEAGCDIRLPDTFQAHPAAALQPLLAGVQGIYAGVDEFSAKVLASEEAAKLQIISRWGVGYDSIDVAAATELGIVITYTPGLLDDAVADYTFALLLGVARRIHTGHLSMHTGGWSQQWGHDVHGKTLGIVGCGRIGTAVARRAAGFNMRLLAYDPVPNETAQDLGVEFVSLGDVAAAKRLRFAACSRDPGNRRPDQCASTAPHEAEQLPDQRRPRRVSERN